jgi:hypothetical protein
MPLPGPLRALKDRSRHLRRWPLVSRLQRANRDSREPVVAPGGPVVSMTTHGARLHKVHLALESIAAGGLKPSRLMLWLDDPASLANLPDPLRRLQARGLEVRLSDNFGPHTKYYPYLLTLADDDAAPLVTADDDMLYAADWLAGLAQAHAAEPALVHCWRAKDVVLDGRKIAPFARWSYCRSPQPSLRHHAEGVSGVIYPIDFQQALRRAGDAFRACCPRADDVWLHAQAVREGRPVRQLRPEPRSFPCIPGTEAQGLMHENLAGAQNDRQIAATYSDADINKLMAAADPL